MYGPGPVETAHSVDEHVSVDELIASTKVFALSIADWCGYESG
jgi:acetylornithine deacetylase/succinyl-diaminopimelate desuccinylase-like protein